MAITRPSPYACAVCGRDRRLDVHATCVPAGQAAAPRPPRCTYPATGRFCLHACPSCSERMFRSSARAVEGQRRQLARLARSAPAPGRLAA